MVDWKTCLVLTAVTGLVSAQIVSDVATDYQDVVIFTWIHSRQETCHLCKEDLVLFEFISGGCQVSNSRQASII